MIQRVTIRIAPVLDGVRKAIRRYPAVFVSLLTVAGLASWALTGWLAWFAYDLSRNLPDGVELGGIEKMVQATTLFDSQDEPVFAIFKEQRIDVPLDRVAPHLVQAVLAIEDQRFFEHGGVDVVRVAGAAVANLRQGRAAQGGSTITQQLARQSFLTPAKHIRRKLQEVLLAAQIENAFSKEQILELYLNKVYFGDGFYGVEAAALGFFGKHASEVDVAEAALLAGLIQSPSAYAPTIALDRAVARRNVVLRAMLDMGAIDPATHDEARQSEVRLFNALEREAGFGLYFKEQVRRELIERFGFDRVYEGGLRVYTTLDVDLQKAAEAAVAEGLEQIEALPAFERARKRAAAKTGRLEGALVALDPRTGAVHAMVGGRSFDDSHFNRAVQAQRQPGSAFKPFVFAAALEEGFTPATVLHNLDEPIDTPQGPWTPDDGHSEESSMTLRNALRISSNRAAAHLLQGVGVDRAVDYAEAMNVGKVPRVPSVALGAGEVTLQSMTAAYAAFANGGAVPQPTLIRRIEDRDGTVLYEAEPVSKPAVRETTAFLMANMMADVINAGTAHRVRREGFTLPAAGKTGTTNDYHDAWFLGFTPSIVSGVWVGFDQPQTIMPGGYAADLAVPIWASFMKAATKDDKPEWIPRPKGIVAVDICRMSGGRPGDQCRYAQVLTDDGEMTTRSYVYTEYFVSGTEPYEECDIHRRPSFFDRVASAVGATQEVPPLVSQATPSLPAEAPPPVAATAGAHDAEPAVEEPPKKKRRGFFARMFGIGSDDDDEEKEKEQEEREKKERERKERERRERERREREQEERRNDNR